jgi:hypothetical protein
MLRFLGYDKIRYELQRNKNKVRLLMIEKLLKISDEKRNKIKKYYRNLQNYTKK